MKITDFMKPRRIRARKSQKRLLIERRGGKCAYCGVTTDLTIDHIKPRSKGGANRLENMQLLCRKHNQMKADHKMGFLLK